VKSSCCLTTHGLDDRHLWKFDELICSSLKLNITKLLQKMKTKNLIKTLLITLASIFLLSANTKTENSFEEEVQKLFNGIPIHEGIPEIVKNSGLHFQFSLTTHFLVSNAAWVTELDEFKYLDSPTTRIELGLAQDSGEKNMDAIMSL